MLVLSLVSWLLIGIAAAWVGKRLGSDALGWLGTALFGVAGAIAGGLVALSVSDAFTVGVIGAAIGGLMGVFIRGTAEEIRTPGPGIAA